MSKFFNNVPKTTLPSSSDKTVQVFDQYYQAPVELNNSALVAMTGFFEKRGFEKDSAESTAIVILQQATKDKINPLQIMDTLRGLSDVEISTLVGEILNYNRFKTSSLGMHQITKPVDFVNRNIIA